jgi:hypothetical protein
MTQQNSRKAVCCRHVFGRVPFSAQSSRSATESGGSIREERSRLDVDTPSAVSLVERLHQMKSGQTAVISVPSFDHAEKDPVADAIVV